MLELKTFPAELAFTHSNLAIKTPDRYDTNAVAFIVMLNFEDISHFILVFLLLTLKK